MVDRSDSILWQRMATEEMRREARRRGMKLSDLEEERALSVALQESATIAPTISTLTSHHSTAVINNNSTVSSPSISSLIDRPSLVKSEQTRFDEENTEDDDALPDHDQLLPSTIIIITSPSSSSTTTTVGPSTIRSSATTAATASTVTDTDTSTDIAITTTTELSIWQTSLPLEITNKVHYHFSRTCVPIIIPQTN